MVGFKHHAVPEDVVVYIAVAAGWSVVSDYRECYEGSAAAAWFGVDSVGRVTAIVASFRTAYVLL